MDMGGASIKVLLGCIYKSARLPFIKSYHSRCRSFFSGRAMMSCVTNIVHNYETMPGEIEFQEQCSQRLAYANVRAYVCGVH